MTELTVQNRQRTYQINKQLVDQIVRKLLEITEFSPTILNIIFVSNKKIAELNKRFHSTTGSTDVLTFDYDLESNTCEIFLSLEMANTNATRFRTKFEKEILLYIIHGMLHLIGYTDSTKNNRLQMEAEQKRILNSVASLFDLTNLVRQCASRQHIDT